MNITEALARLREITKTKFTQTELGIALGKTRSDINAKAKRGTELKLGDIQKIEKYILEKYSVEIDLINTKVIQNSEKDAFVEVLAKSIGVDINNAQTIIAKGDSMHPTIEDGDRLLVDISKKDVYDGKIYCVKIDEQLQAKRLQVIPPDKIKVISDNKDKYDSFYINHKVKSKGFDIIGEIKWWGRLAR